INENPGAYIIVVGWYGRAYLYKHLVDEFWETKEEFQFLRDKAMAFHHVSKNLGKVEKHLEQFGKVVGSDKLGRMAVGNTCNDCKVLWGDISNGVIKCPQCNSTNIVRA